MYSSKSWWRRTMPNTAPLAPVWISPTTRYCRGVCSLLAVVMAAVFNFLGVLLGGQRCNAEHDDQDCVGGVHQWFFNQTHAWAVDDCIACRF